MAKQGSGLNFVARLSTQEAIKNAREFLDELKKIKKEAGIAPAPVNFASLSGATEANKHLKNALLESQLASQKLRLENLELDRSFKQGRISAQEATAESRRLRNERIQLANAARTARQAEQAAAGSYDEASRRLQALGRSIKAAEGGFNSTNPAIREQIKEYRQLNQALKDFDAQMGNHQRNVGNYSGALHGVLGDLKSLALSYISVQGALQLAMASFNANLALDSVEASLKFTLGSADAAKAKLDDLRESAKRLGIDFTPLATIYSSFAGAAKAANFPLAQTNKIFDSVSGAAARFHLTSDQLSGALLALQQMISKGTVQSEELRGQLGERLPGAFSIAARAMGVTEKQLGKMLQNGEVLAADLLPRLSDELNKTFNLDKSTQIDSLTASTNRLKTAFDNLLQGEKLGGFFKKIIDGWTNVLDEVGKLFDSKKPLWDRISRGFSLDTRAEDIQDNYKSSNTFLRNNNLNPIGTSKSNVVSALADQSLEDLTKLRQKYIEAAEQAAKAVNIYRAAIKAGDLRDGGKVRLAAAENNFKTIQSGLDLLNTAYGQVLAKQPKVVQGAKEIADEQLKSIGAIRKRIADLSKLDGSAIEGSAIDKRIKALKERLKELNGGDDKQYDSALKARNDLQARIAELTKKGTDKQLSADEQEVESVKDKYAKMLEAARKFNNDPENKKRGLRVDAGGLREAQGRELLALNDKQSAEKLNVTLSEQKKLYDEYEDYKTKVGEEEANKRYKTDLNNYATYLEALNAKRDQLLGQDQKSKGGSEADNATVQQQLKLVDEEIAAEILANKKKNDEIYADAYNAALTYDQALESIQKRYNTRVAILGANITKEQQKRLDDDRRQQMDALGEEALQQMDAYRELYDNIDTLSTKQALKDIQTLRETAAAMFALGRISASEFQRIFRELDEAEAKVKDKLPAGLKSIASGFGELSNEVGKFDEGLGKALGTLSNILNSVADIKDNLNKFNAPGTSVFSKISSGLGILGAGISIISSIGSLFDKSKERAEQQAYAAELQVKATESLNKVLERQLALTKEIYGPERLEAYKKNLNDIQKAQNDAVSSLAGLVTLSGNKELDAIIAKRNNGEDFSHKFANTERKDYEDYIKELKRTGQYVDLTKQSVEQLTVLMQSGKLDEKTSAIVQNLINLEQQAKDTANALTEELTGINFDSLADEIKGVFDSGEASVENFAAAIEKSIKGAFSNAFQRNEVYKAMQPFYDQLDEAGKDGVFSQDEIDTLRSQKDAIAKLLADKAKAYQAIIGSDDADDSSALNKSIKSITSDQANALEGIQRGQYDQLKIAVKLRMDANAANAAFFQSALLNLKSLEDIKLNTGNTVDRLDRAVSELKDSNAALNKIVNNTNGKSLRGMGL